MSASTLVPIPAHFDQDLVGQVWRVPYQERANQAAQWARQQQIRPASTDNLRVCLLLVDVQNTFCLPEFELFVAGRSGLGAVEDNRRLCQFLYRQLGSITEIVATLDTHTAMQIFHPIFWVDAAGQHPTPAATLIALEDVQRGRWQVNPALAHSLGELGSLRQHALHYVKCLTAEGKYPLTIWPYHAMLGGIGHALVAAVEEAIFFHAIARSSQTHFEIKGNNPLTENYSALSPEVLAGPDGKAIARKNASLIERLLGFDVVIVAGQAKSHCVAWTLQDLLLESPDLASKIYILEDCTSPVVVPGVIDYTEMADATFARFAQAGMYLVHSTQPMSEWPRFPADKTSN